MLRSLALLAATAIVVGVGILAPRFLPAQVAIGNVCSTAVGRYPGPSKPLGSSCTIATPYGPASGLVTQ
jgi:hypothetical protein